MVSWDTRISSVSGYADSSHREIWSGDHHNPSFSSTRARNSWCSASLDGFGRCALRLDLRCPRTARYRRRPPLEATSRDTVEGDRPNRRAIHRNDSPVANPREISSRSPNDNRSGHQSPAGTGRFHPAATRWVLIDDGALPKQRPIDRKDSPASYRSHSSVFSNSENRSTTHLHNETTTLVEGDATTP